MQGTDFTFAWEGAAGATSAWNHLRVARLHGQERISEPYRYEIHLVAPSEASEVDPYDLVGKRATLRIATQAPIGQGAPEFRVVHGVVIEAADVAPVPGGQLYRVVLAPPIARAAHRRRCRIFLDKTTRHIIDHVLKGDPLMRLVPGASVDDDIGAPDFEPAHEQFTWRVRDASRIDDVRARPFVVQYNESDLAFVQRLLEAEGLSYHFENGDGACLLVIADHDTARLRVGRATVGGAHNRIDHVHAGARQRPTVVTVDDYNWKKPRLELAATAEDARSSLREYHYPGGYPDTKAQGEPLAAAIIERYAVEASYVAMDGAIRTLSAGAIFTLDGGADDYDGEYLVTSIDLHGEQAGALSSQSTQAHEPFRVALVCARRGVGERVADSRFRPAKATPRPRIVGSQTALVTADPSSAGSEVHVGGPDGLSLGCVRVKFHWDTETARLAKEPSSCWVRVNQPFAGVGEGGVWHPRVGVEVIVDFEEGDPDRPIIVGRLYNGAHLPPRTHAAHSTMKSFATPGGAVYNEMTFEDNAGSELLHVHAGKDHNTDVGNDRSESVEVDATMRIGSNNAETIGVNCTVNVGANHTLTVGANQTLTVGANSTTTIAANSVHTVGANKSKTIGAAETIEVGATITETVGAAVTETYGASKTTSLAGSFTETFAATKMLTVGGDVTTICGGPHTLTVNGVRSVSVGGNREIEAGPVVNNVNGIWLNLIGGEQKVTAPSVTKNCPIHFVFTPMDSDNTPSKSEMKGHHVSIKGISLAAKGKVAEATGLSLSATGLEVTITGLGKELSVPKQEDGGADLEIYGVALYMHGMSLEA